MITRPIIVIALVVMVVSAYGLFQIKHKVQNLKRDLVEIHMQLAQDREAIHVLKAEWAYLNQPDRIKALADQNLRLNYVMASQITDWSETPSSFADNKESARPDIKPTLKPILSSLRSY